MNAIKQKQKLQSAQRHENIREELRPEKVNGWCVIIEAIRASNRWPAGMQFAIFILGIAACILCVWKIGAVETAAGGAAASVIRQAAGRTAKK